MTHQKVGLTPLNDQDLFLVTADHAAKGHEYFHWPVVARLLHWNEARSKQAMAVLYARNLLTTRGEIETRFLPAGRELARRLAAGSAAGTEGRPRTLAAKA